MCVLTTVGDVAVIPARVRPTPHEAPRPLSEAARVAAVLGGGVQLPSHHPVHLVRIGPVKTPSLARETALRERLVATVVPPVAEDTLGRCICSRNSVSIWSTYKCDERGREGER